MRSDIPFNENLADARHCLQAALKSALEAIPPYRRLSFADLDRLTGFREGKMTWPMRTYYELGKLGYGIQIYDSMDFECFAQDPNDYMDRNFGVTVADFYRANSDVDEAVESTRLLLDQRNVRLERTTPNLNTLAKLLDCGYLCICHIDQNQLVGDEGQGDHSVLVFGLDGEHVHCHNPGPPPERNQKIERLEFERIWEYPTIEAKTIIAIKANVE